MKVLPPQCALLMVAIGFGILAGSGVLGAEDGFPLPQRTVLIELNGAGSSDPDGDRLHYYWRQVAGPKMALSNNRSAKPYFRTSIPGVYKFELVVSDGRHKSKPVLVEIVVERENRAPEARVRQNRIEVEAGSTVTFDGSLSRDADGDALAYHWRQVSGPPLYLEPKRLRGEKLKLSPTQPGIYELELIVSDGRAKSIPRRCRLVVRDKNRAPVARIAATGRTVIKHPLAELQVDLASGEPTAFIEGPEFGLVSQGVVLSGRKSLSPRGKKLKYYWKQRSGPFVRSFDRTRDEELRFTPPKAGTYVFELVVSDGRRDSPPARRTLRVTTTNEAPVAVIEVPGNAVAGAKVELDGSRSFDKEGQPLTYHWRQTGGPRILNYSVDQKRGSAVPAFVPKKAGAYTFELVVSDGKHRSRPATAPVQVVTANHRPRARVAGQLTVAPGQTAVIQGAGEDADGDRLHYRWRQLRGPTLLRGVARQQSLTLTPRRPGIYTFELVVSDGKSESAPVTTTLRVSAAADREIAAPRKNYLDPPSPAALESGPELESSNPAATGGKRRPARAAARFFQRLIGGKRQQPERQREEDVSISAPPDRRTWP